ncbi:MAG: hypothetical protein ACRCT8_14545 [Lacipirellulaceae bacterium]
MERRGGSLLGAAATRCAFAASLFAASLASAQEIVSSDGVVVGPTMMGEGPTPIGVGLEPASTAYPDGTFGEQLSAAANGCGPGAGGSRYRTGPGRCDDWKTGPRWRATLDGIVLFREEADLGALIDGMPDLAGRPFAVAPEFQENFDHGAGARLLVTSDFPQSAGYELQVGYVGVEDWSASAFFPQETIAANPPASTVPVNERRRLAYDSGLHSAEINFQRVSRGYLKPYAGFRYVGLHEDIQDFADQFTTGVLPDPGLAVGDVSASTVTDRINGVSIDNDLVGFQGGLRLDMWRPTRRFHVSGFCSAGVYCNLVSRERSFEETSTRSELERVTSGGAAPVVSVANSTTTTSTGSVVSADGTNLAFTTEAAVAGVWQMNSCLALRSGYQVLFLSGVEVAEDLWLGGAPDEQDLVLHGWFAGFEYRR